jgi:hypothetical protein
VAIERLIDFQQSNVITPMIEPPRPRLIVNGVLPFQMEVSLVPLAYVSRPTYWGIQVVGSSGDSMDPRPTQPITSIPYSVEIDLAGITGTEGVEVIGASMTERHVVSS